MTRIKIMERAELDPGGKRVDVYPEMELVQTFVFNRSDMLNRESILPKIIQVLLKIRRSKNKKIRNRDFPVWAGEITNSLGMELFCVAIPNEIAYDVFNEFYRVLESEETYLENGAWLLRDTGGEPIARYAHGKIIVYGDDFEKAENLSLMLPKHEEEIEFRSWQTVEKKKAGSRSWQKVEKKKTQSVYVKPVEPNRKAKFLSYKGLDIKQHILETWVENREIIMEFVYELKGPCGYKRLKKMMWDYFGIAVFEESSAEFGKYGCIRLSWINDETTAVGVRILINNNLDDRLKYIILAHEFSHYIHHFPLLLMGQIVEEHACTIPEIELYYQQLLNSEYPDLWHDVELDAFEFTSFFLIPAKLFPIRRLSNVILERGRNPELDVFIWRLLQSLFPDSNTARLTWTEYDKTQERAKRDIYTAMSIETGGDDTILFDHLFNHVLSAVLRIEKEMISRNRVSTAIDEIMKKMTTILAKTIDMDVEDARACIKNQVCNIVSNSKTNTVNPGDITALTDFGLSSSSFGREIIPPLEPSKDSFVFPRIPLIPAIFNPEGDPEGDWQYLPEQQRSPYGTVEDWRNHRKDHGVILYRLESWQKKLLKKI